MFKRLFSGSRMTRECHVRFCEKLSGFVGGFTHQNLKLSSKNKVEIFTGNGVKGNVRIRWFGNPLLSEDDMIVCYDKSPSFSKNLYVQCMRLGHRLVYTPIQGALYAAILSDQEIEALKSDLQQKGVGVSNEPKASYKKYPTFRGSKASGR